MAGERTLDPVAEDLDPAPHLAVGDRRDMAAGHSGPLDPGPAPNRPANLGPDLVVTHADLAAEHESRPPERIPPPVLGLVGSMNLEKERVGGRRGLGGVESCPPD